jgi:hypothetical protein
MAASVRGHGSTFQGPTLEDCQRLWWTIGKDLMNDAQIVIRMSEEFNPTTRPNICVVSPGLDAETGGVKLHTWATKTLNQNREAISYQQLYELLIVAYTNMEAHLRGEPLMPLP